MKLELRYPATPDNALDHAQLAVEVAWEEFGVDLDFSPGSLEAVDTQVESLREEGSTGEAPRDPLVLVCYVGEVMSRARRSLDGDGALAAAGSSLAMVGAARGSAWDRSGRSTSGSSAGLRRHPRVLVAAAPPRRGLE